MANLNESEKRDFVVQVIARLTENQAMLAEKGFAAEGKITELTGQSATAQNAETAQQQAIRASKEATDAANEALVAVYKNASASVELIVGLLGKDHELSQQLRKLRN